MDKNMCDPCAHHTVCQCRFWLKTGMHCPVGRGEDQWKKVREHKDAATYIRKCHSRSHMLSNTSHIPRQGCRSLSPHYQVWFVCKACKGDYGKKVSEGEKEKGKGKNMDKGKGKAVGDEDENDQSVPMDPGNIMKYLGFDPAAEVRRGTYHPKKRYAYCHLMDSDGQWMTITNGISMSITG